MCRLTSEEFEKKPSSVARSWRFVLSVLARWELADLSDVAMLLTSELMTNAIDHAHSDPTVTLAVADGVLEVGVADQGSLPPGGLRSQQLDPLALNGRGLMLVDSLAQEWGVAKLSGGKQVWFRLDTAHWSFRSACICQGNSKDRVRLESGRYAVVIPEPFRPNAD